MITRLSFILIFISAVIHPLWNILLKKSDQKVVFYLHIHLIFTVIFSFLLFIFPLAKISLMGWIFILLSSLAHFFYQIYLCQAYERGDISLTYPIIRSSPVFVTLFGFIFLKEIPSLTGILGIVLVIFGAWLINQKNFNLTETFGFFRLKANTSAMLYAATMTAIFSALYSVIDKKGVLLVHPVLFFYLFFAFSGLWFGLYILFLREERKFIIDVYKKDKYKILVASLLEFSSYVLILYAFQLSKVAYVIALRQISVVFGVIFGTYFLKEQYAAVRFFASCIIFAGIYLITVFG